MSDLAVFVGRWHPLVVHVPIGALAAAALLWLAARRTRWRAVMPAVAPLVVLGAVSAVTAAGTGYLLGRSGGYAGATFVWHERAGIALASCGTLAALASIAPGRLRSLAGPLLALSLPLIVIAGHLGGELTHGEHYLTEHAPSWLGGHATGPLRPRVPGDVHVYADLVAPVFAEHCVACHGAVDPRGALRLDTPEGIRKGGHSGPVIVPGRAASSEIVRRVWLPASHKDAMPPRGRRALAVADASLLRWWIDQGASFDATLAGAELDPPLRAAVEASIGPLLANAPAILAVKVPAADPGAVAKVKALGVSVSPLADGTSLLQVHCTNVTRSFGDAELAALAPIALQVTWLSIGDTQVTDAGLATLSRFTNLSRLHLEGTRVTDAGLAHLARLPHLEYLNLYGSAVTDAGLSQLAGLGSLRELYVWRTAVTPAGADRLRASLPRLRVDLGDSIDQASHDAARPAADSLAPSPRALRP